MDDRSQLAQQKLARGHGLGQPERQELGGRGRLGVLTGGLAVGLRAARENVFVNRRRRS